MATSTETTLTNTWAEVVASGDYILQNNGVNDVFLFWKATAPAASDVGVRIKPGQGINSGTFLTGKIYARCPAGSGSVVVNA